MTITNFKWISPVTNAEYIIDGEIELFPSTGFNFTKLTKINNVEIDSVVLRSHIKHEDIFKHIEKINNIS